MSDEDYDRRLVAARAEWQRRTAEDALAQMEAERARTQDETRRVREALQQGDTRRRLMSMSDAQVLEFGAQYPAYADLVTTLTAEREERAKRLAEQRVRAAEAVAEARRAREQRDRDRAATLEAEDRRQRALQAAQAARVKAAADLLWRTTLCAHGWRKGDCFVAACPHNPERWSVSDPEGAWVPGPEGV